MEPEEIAGLIPTWIATRQELDSEEAQNIASAMLWAGSRTWSMSDFDEAMVRDLHRRMFGEVWRWAGRYRQSDTNIGVPWYDVPTETQVLLLDLGAQTRSPARLPWSVAELAVRFHYNLVRIHPFANGNGRHARLVSDLIVRALDGPPLGWGTGQSLMGEGPARAEYLGALRETDETGTFTRLVAFATLS